MVATVERPVSDRLSRQANCQACLTRNCPLNGMVDSPVTICNTFREANCAFCAVKECPMNGQLNSSVMSCSSFQLLGAAS